MSVSVARYLNTSYRPDCGYIDGEVRARNVGELPHAGFMILAAWGLAEFEKSCGVRVYPCVRMQISPSRIRVPDVIVTRGVPVGQIVTEPPFLCIEILSPRDGFADMMERIQDYLAFGVRYVWVIDPKSRKGFVYTADSFHDAQDGILATTDPGIHLNILELE